MCSRVSSGELGTGAQPSPVGGSPVLEMGPRLGVRSAARPEFRPMAAMLGIDMPVQGEYEPSPAQWVRDQVDEYEGSGGTQGTTLRDTGLPVVVITNLGAKSGKVRKAPLMRVEHQGLYAAVGSSGGDPQAPLWVHNFRVNPRVELQDGGRKQDMVARELT